MLALDKAFEPEKLESIIESATSEISVSKPNPYDKNSDEDLGISSLHDFGLLNKVVETIWKRTAKGPDELRVHLMGSLLRLFPEDFDLYLWQVTTVRWAGLSMRYFGLHEHVLTTFWCNIIGWEKHRKEPVMSNSAAKYLRRVSADSPPLSTFGNGLFSFFCLDALIRVLFLLYFFLFPRGRCQWPNFTIFVQIFDRIIEIFKDSESDESADLIKQASVFSSLAYKLDRMVTPRAE
jgi:hypothetical protein